MNFRTAHFQFTLRPRQPLRLPAENAGNAVRGAFGTLFRGMCCPPECADARTCQVRTSCPYARIFDPGPPPGATALSSHESIPRPFVFRVPPLAPALCRPGESFPFELLLFGSAIEALPYFVSCFSQLARTGFSSGRVPTELASVAECGPDAFRREILDAAAGRLLSPELSFGMDDIRRLGPAPADRIGVRFVSPTHLVAGGRAVEKPEFHHFFKRLRDRVSSLATFYGAGHLEAEFAELGRLAENVRTTRRQTRWESRNRTSTRTGQRHELSGFTGECEFAGDLAPFWDWLLLGQYCHVGKHAVWGNGWYQLAALVP